jgi:sulfatase maturation enzyme AslB (radical SAM superfamily)
MSKTYCPIPFYHTAVRPDGKMFPCCNFRWEEVPSDFNLEYEDLFNKHPYMIKIREEMRNGQPVAGCSRCYDNERVTGESMRTDYIRRATDLGFSKTPPDSPKLTYIDLALSNVCNNRCRMCNPDLSTNWYSDAKKLGIPIKSGIIHNKDKFKDFDFSNITFIKMIGGEPLMEQEKFIEILSKCNLPNLNLLITTNATMIPSDELVEILSKCKNVKWNLSIDAYGALNEFLRKGSNWKNIESNIEWFYKTYSRKIKVDTVVSIYNVNCLDKLSNFLKSNFHTITHRHVLVDGEEWMYSSNLPNDVKAIVEEKLKTFSIDNVDLILDFMNRPGSFKKFLEYDAKLNSIRNEHWKDANTELYKLVKNYV